MLSKNTQAPEADLNDKDLREQQLFSVISAFLQVCVCPSFLLPYMIYPSLVYIYIYIYTYVYICFPLQFSLAISLDLLLLYPCRLQVVEYIHIEYINLLVEIKYNWHLWEKKASDFSLFVCLLEAQL